MTNYPAPTRADQDTAPDSTRTDQHDTAHYRDVLNTLIDQAAALATRIATTAMAPATPDTALPEATVAFERIARTVRHTIALAQHIARPPVAAAQPGTTRTSTRAKLIRGVEDAIYRKRRETDTESLTSEFHERLEDPMLELDLEGRTVEDLIEEISRDLGVAQASRSYVWPRRTPKDLKTLQARAAATPRTPNPSPHRGKAPPRDVPMAAATQDVGTKAATPPRSPGPRFTPRLATTAAQAPIQAEPPEIRDS